MSKSESKGKEKGKKKRVNIVEELLKSKKERKQSWNKGKGF